MKKKNLTAAAVFVLGFANAQNVKFGIKSGLNLSTFKATLPSEQEAIVFIPKNKIAIGFHIGGFAEIPMSDKFSFQPELLFSLEGSKFEVKESESDNYDNTTYTYSSIYSSAIKTNYINVPLMFKFKATEKLFLAAGPQFGFLMSAKEDYIITNSVTSDGQTITRSDSKNDIDIKKDFKSVSYALDLGAGYFFTDQLFAEARYNIGLSNDAKPINETLDGENNSFKPVYKASTIQISIGYRF